MATTKQYKTLFKLELLHHYFLNEGNRVYGNPAPPVWEQRLANNRRQYNLSDFFSITPTLKTQQVLKNQKATFRMQNDGIIVGIQVVTLDPIPDPEPLREPFIAVDDNFIMDFVIKVTDSYFENYTDTIWNKDKLVMISNQAPDPADTGDNHDWEVPVEFSLLSDYESNVPGTFMDVDLLQDIDKTELVGAFGLIRMHLRGDSGEVNLVNTATPALLTPPDPMPIIAFQNRETLWRYKSNTDGSIIWEPSNTNDTRPLTKNGYINVPPDVTVPERYPNPDARLIIKEGAHYYSENIHRTNINFKQ